MVSDEQAALEQPGGASERRLFLVLPAALHAAHARHERGPIRRRAHALLAPYPLSRSPRALHVGRARARHRRLHRRAWVRVSRPQAQLGRHLRPLSQHLPEQHRHGRERAVQSARAANCHLRLTRCASRAGSTPKFAYLCVTLDAHENATRSRRANAKSGQEDSCRKWKKDNEEQ